MSVPERPPAVFVAAVAAMLVGVLFIAGMGSALVYSAWADALDRQCLVSQ